MDVMLLRCHCSRWSRAEAGWAGRGLCPACGEALEIPGAAAPPALPRRRHPLRWALAALLAPALGFTAAAAAGDWRGVWQAVASHMAVERRLQAQFDEILEQGRGAEQAGDVRGAIARYKEAVKVAEPGSSRHAEANDVLAAAKGRRAAAREDRLKEAARAGAARDYAAAQAALTEVASAFEAIEPEAVDAAKGLAKLRAAAERLPKFRGLLARGDDLSREKRYEAALAAYTEAGSLFPDDDSIPAIIARIESDRELLAEQLCERAGSAEAAGDFTKATELLAQVAEEVGGSRREEAKRRLADSRSALAGDLARRGRGPGSGRLRNGVPRLCHGPVGQPLLARSPGRQALRRP